MLPALMAGASLVGGALGALGSKGSKQTQTQTTVNEPWSAQAPYLKTAFSDAQSNYDMAKARGPYEGALSAGMTAPTQTGIQQMTDFSTGQGQNLQSGAANVALTGFGAMPTFQQNAASLAANGAGPANATAANTLEAAASGAPLAALSQPGMQGVSAQNTALTNAGGILAGIQGDPNAQIRSAALGYADPSITQGTVDAALRDVSRNLNETTLPGLNARAVAGGNLNSARAGAAEAVARRGAEDRAGDIAAGIRQDNYNTGLQTALAARGQNAEIALGANSQIGQIGSTMANTGENARQFDASTRLGAAGNLGQLDLANRNLGVTTQLAGNSQLGDATRMGLGAATTASGLADANAARLLTAGGVQQAEDQRQLDANYEQWNRPYATNQQLLRDFYGIVGANNWGGSSTGTSTASTPANPIGGALGGMSAGMGVAGQLAPALKGFGGGYNPGATITPTLDQMATPGFFASF